MPQLCYVEARNVEATFSLPCFGIFQNIMCWKRRVSFILQCMIKILFSHASFQATHVKITGGLTKSDLKQAKKLGAAWYRSEEQVPIKHNFVGDGYLSNKKWPLIEECTYHEFTVENFYS